MKLNKVLALALSGVMAVSMLAGCSGKTDDNKDEQVPATGVVAAVNNGQTGDVKVTFTADATLDSQLSKAINACAEKATASTVQGKLDDMVGDDIFDLTASTIDAAFTPANVNSVKDGDKTVGVAVFKTADNYTEAAALKVVADEVNKVTSQLEKDTSKNVKVDGKYVAYDYVGTVSMVETTALDGTTNYYVAIVITNTCTVKTVTV